MARRKNFSEALKANDIDPQEWAAARSHERGDGSYYLAREVEDIIEAATFDDGIELRDGETLLDVFGVLFAAMGAWPLSKESAKA